MIPPVVIKALLIAAVVVALGFAWNGFNKHEQNIGYQKAVAEYNGKLLAAKEAADKREQELTTQVQEAQANGLKREETIKALAAAVGKSSVSLRNTAIAIRHTVADIAPGQTLTVDGQAQLPLAQVEPIRQGRHPVLVPLMRVRVVACLA